MGANRSRSRGRLRLLLCAWTLAAARGAMASDSASASDEGDEAPPLLPPLPGSLPHDEQAQTQTWRYHMELDGRYGQVLADA